MVSLRSFCYRFLWGIVARNPFACAKLARTLRKIQDAWNRQGSKLHATVASMAYYHSKSCLLKLTIPLQARGPTYQANNATRKQRNSSPISSRPIMLCNPFGCIFIHFCFNYLRDFGLARSLRVHELARSLWKACARVTPFNLLKNKFHRILKSIAGSFERGSAIHEYPLTNATAHLGCLYMYTHTYIHIYLQTERSPEGIYIYEFMYIHSSTSNNHQTTMVSG